MFYIRIAKQNVPNIVGANKNLVQKLLVPNIGGTLYIMTRYNIYHIYSVRILYKDSIEPAIIVPNKSGAIYSSNRMYLHH